MRICNLLYENAAKHSKYLVGATIGRPYVSSAILRANAVRPYGDVAKYRGVVLPSL